jgi:hypothetical protein
MKTLNINTNNIQEGMYIKNYRELCKLLNLDITTGYSKQVQLREISRYMDILKTENNNSYLVLEIYDKPIPNTVNSKYTQFIQNILLYYLSKEDKPVVYINKSELIRILGLTNNKYLEYKKDKDKLLYLADEYNIAEFYKRCDAKILSILESSLKSLKKRLLIDYSDAYKIYYLDNHDNYIYKIADIEEHQYILDVKKRILNQLGLKSEYQIYLNNDIKDTYYRLINKTVEEEMCWEGIFQCYEIIYNQKHVLKELNDERYRLNREVKRAIDKQAENKYNKFELPDNYITLQKVLSDTLIDLNDVFGSNFN